MKYLVKKYRENNLIYPQEYVQKAKIDDVLFFDIGKLSAAQVNITATRIFYGISPAAKAKKNLDEQLKKLNKILSERKFVTGEQLTLPDISIAAYITTLCVVDFDIYRYENIGIWINRLRENLPRFNEINDAGVLEYKFKFENGDFFRTYKALHEFFKNKQFLVNFI